jgi:hypothetical protein
MPVDLDYALIGPRYFETMRTPVLEGHEFSVREDRNAPRVAIVNQSFVRHFFPDGHPLGRHFFIDLPEVGYGDRAWCRIRGLIVCGNRTGRLWLRREIGSHKD